MPDPQPRGARPDRGVDDAPAAGARRRPAASGLGAAWTGGRQEASARAARARAELRRRWELRRPLDRPLPGPVPPTAVLDNPKQAADALEQARRLALPTPRNPADAWELLGLVATVLTECGPYARVLEVGRPGLALPWLRLYGVTGLIRCPTIASMPPVPAGPFDAVLAPGVPADAAALTLLAERAAPLLRPGGLLVLAGDYDQAPEDDPFGAGVDDGPEAVLHPRSVLALMDTAREHGLVLRGELQLSHTQRPAPGRADGSPHTRIRLALRRRG